jgi:hypothetical protein
MLFSIPLNLHIIVYGFRKVINLIYCHEENPRCNLFQAPFTSVLNNSVESSPSIALSLCLSTPPNLDGVARFRLAVAGSLPSGVLLFQGVWKFPAIADGTGQSYPNANFEVAPLVRPANFPPPRGQFHEPGPITEVKRAKNNCEQH